MNKYVTVTLAIASAAVLAAGCTRREPTPGLLDNESAQVEADNTLMNERDKHAQTVTPMDQGDSDADRRVTADIRRAIVTREDLSMNAKNVKIITNHGIVTLRGPVDTEHERDEVMKAAATQAAGNRVENQLEVRAP